MGQTVDWITSVIPARAGIKAYLWHKCERHREACLSGFQLSPERRTAGLLGGISYPKDKELDVIALSR